MKVEAWVNSKALYEKNCRDSIPFPHMARSNRGATASRHIDLYGDVLEHLLRNLHALGLYRSCKKILVMVKGSG